MMRTLLFKSKINYKRMHLKLCKLMKLSVQLNANRNVCKTLRKDIKAMFYSVNTIKGEG